MKEAKEQKEKLRKQHEEETRFQEECWEELRKKRCEEYVSFQNMVAILKEIRIQELRWVVINAYIAHHTWDTKGAHMALKHCGGVLSAKERNRLQHALNGNIDIPAATFAAAILAGITYLMRRNRTTVVEPRFSPTGDIIGAIQVTANPLVAELTEENTSRSCCADSRTSVG